jgi:hypothetical protein
MLCNRRDTVVKVRGKVTEPGFDEVCKSSQGIKLVKQVYFHDLQISSEKSFSHQKMYEALVSGLNYISTTSHVTLLSTICCF